MLPTSSTLCFVEKNLLFLIFHIISFFYPCFQVISNIHYSNNPKSSHTWNFWSWTKSHWSKSTPPEFSVKCGIPACLNIPLFGKARLLCSLVLWAYKKVLQSLRRRKCVLLRSFHDFELKINCSTSCMFPLLARLSVHLLCFVKGNRKSEYSKYAKNWKKPWWQTSCLELLIQKRWILKWTVEMKPKNMIR